MMTALEPDDVEFTDDDEDWGSAPESSPGEVRIEIRGSTADPYLLRSMVRLVIGGAAEGSELFFERLKVWNTKSQSLGSGVYHEAPDEKRSERLRFGILGLSDAGADVAQSALLGAVHASDSAFRFVSGLLSPVTSSQLMRPVSRRYDHLAARGQAEIERWIDAGRASEQRSRALVRLAADDGSTEVIQVAVGKMAQEPAVRDLVTQQGTGMAAEIIDAVRMAAGNADARWERRTRRVLGRPQVVPAPAVPGVGPSVARPAGFVSRLLAFVLDVVIVTLGAVLLGATISLVLNFFGLGAQQLRAGSPSQILQLIRTLTVVLSLLAVALFVPLYYIVFWHLTGATLGKRVLGLRIVHNGHSISWSRGLLRYIGYFLSALALFVGFFWVLGDRRREGWHDKLAKTQVIYSWDVPASK
jgi:uncharacterized RDD family membrane protein YckC